MDQADTTKISLAVVEKEPQCNTNDVKGISSKDEEEEDSNSTDVPKIFTRVQVAAKTSKNLK
jgi:hypothetical protein